jgi:hypothetical protein
MGMFDVISKLSSRAVRSSFRSAKPKQLHRTASTPRLQHVRLSRLNVPDDFYKRRSRKFKIEVEPVPNPTDSRHPVSPQVCEMEVELDPAVGADRAVLKQMHIMDINARLLAEMERHASILADVTRPEIVAQTVQTREERDRMAEEQWARDAPLRDMMHRRMYQEIGYSFDEALALTQQARRQRALTKEAEENARALAAMMAEIAKARERREAERARAQASGVARTLRDRQDAQARAAQAARKEKLLRDRQRFQEERARREEARARARAENEAKAEAAANAAKVEAEASAQRTQLDQYQDKWKAMQLEAGYVAKGEKLKADLALMSGNDIPWPTFSDSSYASIKAFIMHPHRVAMWEQSGKTKAQMIKQELLHWHPDKFRTVVLERVIEDHKERAAEYAELVTKALNDLKAELAA